MAVATPCQTPDAVYETHISGQFIDMTVKLPFPLTLDEAEAKLLEDNLHNVVEVVLSRYFRRDDG